MKKLWIKFGCFLIGYNYAILKNCSEASAKTVKKYASAILIVMILWAFVGYTFTQRYLHLTHVGSVIGAIILVIVIIQIERQIILTLQKNNKLFIMRGIIALVMAIIGSVIIDQINFKEDIEKHKITKMNDEISQILPERVKEVDDQIMNLAVQINNKESERLSIINEVTAKPTIIMPVITQRNFHSPIQRIDDKGNLITSDTLLQERTTILQSVPNPKANMIGDIDKTITQLRQEKLSKETMIINMRAELEKELMNKVGFLDELKLLFDLILHSSIASFVWGLWLLFFIGIELFVLFSKLGDSKNDYDETIIHQQNLHLIKLTELAKLSKTHIPLTNLN